MGNQFPNGNNGNNGGLSEVHHDDTLTGTGADADNPLGVAVPLTAAEKANLLKLYPRFLAQQGAYVSGSSANANAEMLFADAQGNQLQSGGDFDTIKQIRLNRYSAEYNVVVDDPNVDLSDLDNVDWQTLYDKVVGGLEVVVIRIQRQTDNNRAASYRVLSATAAADKAKYTFVLSKPFAVSGTLEAGSGFVYNVTVGFNRNTVYGSQIVNLDSVEDLDINQVYRILVSNSDGTLYQTDLANFVKTKDLNPKESDFWSAYISGALLASVIDKRWSMVITSDASGTPDNANAYQTLDAVPNNTTVTVFFATTQYGGSDVDDPDNQPPNKTIGTADIGDVLYMYFQGKPSRYIKFTVVSGSVSTLNTGNSAGVYFQATTSIPNALQSQFDDFVAIKDEIPSTFWDGVEIPWTAIVGEPKFTKTDGSNVTDALIAAIQGDNETVRLGNTFTMNNTGATRYVSISTAGELLVMMIKITSNDTDDDEDLQRLLKNAAWARIGADWVVDVTTNANRSVYAGNPGAIIYTFNYIVLEGTQPADDANVLIEVVGKDTHRGELARQSFSQEDPSIDGKGGVERQVWRRGTTNKNADWHDPELLGGVEKSFDTNSWVKYEDYADNELLLMGYATSGDVLLVDKVFRFGDVSTTSESLTTNFQFRRNGTELQIQRTAGSDTLKVRVLKVSSVSS